jgi:cytidine deaminase
MGRENVANSLLQSSTYRIACCLNALSGEMSTGRKMSGNATNQT